MIIGGGISGLVTAYRLATAMALRDGGPLQITLLEAQPRVGGVIRTERREGFLLEAGPDAFLTEKPEALELCRELALEPELIPTNPACRRSFIAWRGRLHEVPEGWYLVAPSRLAAVLRLPLLSWPGRLRMACEPLIPARRQESDESVGAFIRRRFGREALARIGQPMIGGIYTADVDRLSAAATLPQFTEMERRHGSVIRGLAAARAGDRAAESERASGPRYSLFASLRGGIGQLIDALRRRLAGLVEIRTAACVSELRRVEGRWGVVTADGAVASADALCLAIPSTQAVGLLRGVEPPLAAALAGIPYESVATVNLAYRGDDAPGARLAGFGFVVPEAERRPLVGCSFSSVKFAGRAPEGMILVRAFIGGAGQRELLRHDDDALARMASEQLRELAGICGRPSLTSVRRFTDAMPQYLVGHRDRLAAIARLAAECPGLFLTGNGYEGVGIPDCIRQAGETAARIAAWLDRKP